MRDPLVRHVSILDHGTSWKSSLLLNWGDAAADVARARCMLLQRLQLRGRTEAPERAEDSAMSWTRRLPGR